MLKDSCETVAMIRSNVGPKIAIPQPKWWACLRVVHRSGFSKPSLLQQSPWWVRPTCFHNRFPKRTLLHYVEQCCQHVVNNFISEKTHGLHCYCPFFPQLTVRHWNCHLFAVRVWTLIWKPFTYDIGLLGSGLISNQSNIGLSFKNSFRTVS